MKIERNTRSRATIRKDPGCPHPFAIRPGFPEAMLRIEHRVSTPNKKGGLESPVAYLEIAPDPYLNTTGVLTPLLHFKREAEFCASI